MTTMRQQNQEAKLRKVLIAGSIVFGISALFLLLFPSSFSQLLGIKSFDSLDWALRMIGITLVALAGNMYSVSKKGSEASVLLSGRVMLISAAALGVLVFRAPMPGR